MHCPCRRLSAPSFMPPDEARYHPHCLPTKLISIRPSDKAQYHPCCRLLALSFTEHNNTQYHPSHRLPAVPFIPPDKARDCSCRCPRMLTTMLTSDQGSSNTPKIISSPPPPIPIQPPNVCIALSWGLLGSLDIILCIFS